MYFSMHLQQAYPEVRVCVEGEGVGRFQYGHCLLDERSTAVEGLCTWERRASGMTGDAAVPISNDGP